MNSFVVFFGKGKRRKSATLGISYFFEPVFSVETQS